MPTYTPRLLIKAASLLGLSMAALLCVATPAQAGCREDAEAARRQFVAAHDHLSEDAHMRTEKAVGMAFAWCAAGNAAQARTHVREAKGLLMQYARAKSAGHAHAHSHP